MNYGISAITDPSILIPLQGIAKVILNLIASRDLQKRKPRIRIHSSINNKKKHRSYEYQSKTSTPWLWQRGLEHWRKLTRLRREQEGDWLALTCVARMTTPRVRKSVVREVRLKGPVSHTRTPRAACRALPRRAPAASRCWSRRARTHPC